MYAYPSTYYNFYFKRLRRILPLALLIVLLCAIAISVLQTGYEFTNGIKSAVYSMFFMKNYQPHPSLEEDYFQALEKGNDLFTHFWSLCVEIQFYLLAPFLLHLFKPNTENALTNFTYLTVISAASFAYSLLSNQQDAFDDTPARLWQFLAGAMAFHADLEITLRFYTTFLSSLVLVFRSKSVLLCHGSLQIIGDASYSLYLLHWPIMCALDILDIDEWQAKVLAMLAAVALSILCHLGFEKRYLTLTAKSTLILVLGLYVATFCVIGATSHLQQEAMEQESNATPSPLKVLQLTELKQAEIDKQNAKLSKTNSLRYSGCKIKYGGNPIGFCDLKNGNGTLSFLIMGNSYAANLGGLIQKHFKSHYGKLQARAIAQCEPLVNTAKDRYCPNYKPAHKKFDADIERERPDILFLVARYIEPNVPIKKPIETDDHYKFMENRLKFFEERVNKKEAVEADAKPMKERVRKLAEKCSKCVIFDIEPVFLNEAGNFTVLNSQKLRYFDNPRHLNSLGRQLVEPVFERLAKNFERLLDSKYPENIFV
ncbi:hypothetical protein PRIPAC_73297 [Pristionchus pacificus]|uniref:Acyltransferase n=1 Tax=Pristionchus pacificus TaxID=54126 RepID=A0A2A6BFK6_PRIPA|nr:hypothetical protein PRIPAC_73297 [Pristionchus pacificus]|eukprot:PDM64674.1 Acyltransferase [Pristionchus pacificus]